MSASRWDVNVGMQRYINLHLFSILIIRFGPLQNMSSSSIPNSGYPNGQHSRLLRTNQANSSKSSPKNEYFVPGYGISRQVIVEHIQLFLGPGSSARPYSYLGREGFLILTSGQPLTKVGGFLSVC